MLALRSYWASGLETITFRGYRNTGFDEKSFNNNDRLHIFCQLRRKQNKIKERTCPSNIQWGKYIK